MDIVRCIPSTIETPLPPSNSARYNINVENPRGECRGIVRAELDDVALSGHQARIPLTDDGTTHRERTVFGWSPPSRRAPNCFRSPWRNRRLDLEGRARWLAR